MEKKISTWDELPDTITPLDLAKILRCGTQSAREMFNTKGFPRIKCVGTKQLADKQAVRCWILGVDINATVIERILNEIRKVGAKNEKN